MKFFWNSLYKFSLLHASCFIFLALSVHQRVLYIHWSFMRTYSLELLRWLSVLSHNRIKFMLWSASSAKVFAITPPRRISHAKQPRVLAYSEINAEVISFRVRSADKRPSSCLQVLRDNKHRHSRRDTSHASKKDFFALCWPTIPTFSFQAARQPQRNVAVLKCVTLFFPISSRCVSREPSSFAGTYERAV